MAVTLPKDDLLSALDISLSPEELHELEEKLVTLVERRSFEALVAGLSPSDKAALIKGLESPQHSAPESVLLHLGESLEKEVARQVAILSRQITKLALAA